MTNSEFMKILNNDSIELTTEELENIIEEELQKDESEMDPDLIEYCLYYINKTEAGGQDKKAESAMTKHKNVHMVGKLKKSLAIAATIALLLLASVIVSIASNEKLKNSAISFYDNHIRIHFNEPKDADETHGTEIARELKKHNVSAIKLPAIFLSKDCTYEEVTQDNTEGLNVITLLYQANKMSGKICIKDFHSEEIIPPIDFHNTDSHSKVEQLLVNGMTVYVIAENDFCSIAYQDNLTQYIIYLDANFATTIEIAKTISGMEVQ